MDFHSHGAIQHGWFSSWKIPSIEMDDDWGYPYFRKLLFMGLTMAKDGREPSVNMNKWDRI